MINVNIDVWNIISYSGQLKLSILTLRARHYNEAGYSLAGDKHYLAYSASISITLKSF
jgi:hypothetical protein